MCIFPAPVIIHILSVDCALLYIEIYTILLLDTVGYLTVVSQCIRRCLKESPGKLGKLEERSLIGG